MSAVAYRRLWPTPVVPPTIKAVICGRSRSQLHLAGTTETERILPRVVRVLDLHPRLLWPGEVGRIEPFRDDSLEILFNGQRKERFAVVLDRLGELDTRTWR